MANRSGKVESATDCIFLGSNINVDGDYSHEVKKKKKNFAPWNKSYDKPRQHIEKQIYHFTDKVHIVKTVFSTSYVWMWELDQKKAEPRRTDGFKLWCWRRFLRISWSARGSNQSSLKKTNPEYSMERLMLKMKLQYFGYLMWRANSLEKSEVGKDWRQKKKRMAEDEMVG